jgi:DNA ligase (NAD+)
LFEVGITVKEPEKVVLSSDKLQGMSFCFTGAIQATKPDGKRYARDDMHALVIQNGGTVEKAITKNLTYLVMVDPSSTSSKAQKAKQMGTSILGEKQFFEMID